MKVNGQSPCKCSQNYSCSHAKFKCNSSFTVASFICLWWFSDSSEIFWAWHLKCLIEKIFCDGQKCQLPEATLRSPKKTMGHRRCHLNCGNANHWETLPPASDATRTLSILRASRTLESWLPRQGRPLPQTPPLQESLWDLLGLAVKNWHRSGTSAPSKATKTTGA